MEGIIIKGKHMHQFKQAISWTCLVNKEAVWVCQIMITIICCHGESLKATYELSDIQYMIAFRAQLLLFPCFWTALWPWIFWAGTQEGCIKKELLNIDFFFLFLLASGIKINARNSSILLKLTRKRCFIKFKCIVKETGIKKQETSPADQKTS